MNIVEHNFSRKYLEHTSMTLRFHAKLVVSEEKDLVPGFLSIFSGSISDDLDLVLLFSTSVVQINQFLDDGFGVIFYSPVFCTILNEIVVFMFCMLHFFQTLPEWLLLFFNLSFVFSLSKLFKSCNYPRNLFLI